VVADAAGALPLPRPIHPVPAFLTSSLGCIADELAFHMVSGLQVTMGGLGPGYVCHIGLFRMSDSLRDCTTQNIQRSNSFRLTKEIVHQFASIYLDRESDIVEEP
jgi:hypothetical protein